jgi:hypothetical protein
MPMSWRGLPRQAVRLTLAVPQVRLEISSDGNLRGALRHRSGPAAARRSRPRQVYPRTQRPITPARTVPQARRSQRVCSPNLRSSLASTSATTRSIRA